MAEHTIQCHDCGTLFTFDGNLSFREECGKCAADLHACLTCRFYDTQVENECRETEADPIQVKDRRNLCEYWKPSSPSADETSPADAAKAKLAALFGDKGAAPPTAEPDEHRQRLDALFKSSDKDPSS